MTQKILLIQEDKIQEQFRVAFILFIRYPPIHFQWAMEFKDFFTKHACDKLHKKIRNNSLIFLFNSIN